MKLLSNLIIFSSLTESRRPNVILLNTDDFGIGDFQIYNREAKVPTPNIDRLGNEGVKFMSASSASSRCAPSRYMLMTGRYSMEDSEHRKIDLGQPHLGTMFKNAGYKTAEFGKNQPLPGYMVNRNATVDEHQERNRQKDAFKERMKEIGGLYDRLKMNYNKPGLYEKSSMPHEYGYDYSFLNSALCCEPGGYYENGIGIEPMDTYLRQLPYPESRPIGAENFNRQRGGCTLFPYTGYMGPEKYDKPYYGDILDLGIYFCNYGIEALAMKSYDSRLAEEKVVPKLENFIDEHADEEFFVYYGMRSGHGPYNTPERFRNQTEVGMLGEMIMEADEIVGRILTKLEDHGIADDTLMMFMSDNGPNSSAEDIFNALGHNQRQMDLPDGTSIRLPGKKNSQDEAGNRTPFLWRYPNRFSPKSIYDPKVPVSTVDVYATLAELINYDLECNEAPDSRSLVSYLETGEADAELQQKPIMTHANQRAENGLYNLLWDPETKNNLFYDVDKQALVAHMDNYLNDWLAHLAARDAATEKGKKRDSCFPEFHRFTHLNL